MLSNIVGVNSTIVPKPFPKWLNFANLKCQLVKISNMVILYTFLPIETLQVQKIKANLEYVIVFLTPTILHALKAGREATEITLPRNDLLCPINWSA